jgi:uncharacterized membrane protein YeaQ/YmgE (transglycosylase-associated protein family)
MIIGGIAGCLAPAIHAEERRHAHELIMGIIGAAIASRLFGFLGIEFGNGWLGYLVAGFIGACIFIWVARWARRPA